MPITLEEYIKFVKKLESKAPPIPTNIEPNLHWGRLVHAALGLTTEGLELYESKSKGVPAQLAELGDICYFAALAIDELGQTTIPCETPANLDNLLILIEAFGSRIKSGLFYETLEKSTDQYPWRMLPARIFLMAQELGKRGGYDVLEINMKKLETRYRDKVFKKVDATTKRDTVTEDKVIAQAVAKPTFVQYDPKRGRTILGD